MKLFDGIKRRLGLGGSVDEIVQAAAEDEQPLVPANRAYRRAIARSTRRKGPGYTRPMEILFMQLIRTQCFHDASLDLQTRLMEVTKVQHPEWTRSGREALEAGEDSDPSTTG